MQTARFIRYAVCLALTLTGGLQTMAQEAPTMGWSSWNTYRVNISDSLIRTQADAMVRLGLERVGYRYVNIDDGFFGGRDGEGRLQIHATRFPHGLQPVVQHIHGLGLKAGIYSDAGRNTCGSFWDKDTAGVGVGLYGHEQQDARLFFDSLRFDFIKIDFCGGDAKQNADALQLDERERYTAIRRAIDAVGRKDVRINVCRWAFPGTWVSGIGSSWRIAGDITPTWQSVKRIIRANRYLSAYATGGCYNDMDMLEIGRGLSDAEERTHFAMWCIQSSPLLIGCDLNTIPQASLQLITNPELLALNQDVLCLQAYIAQVQDGVSLYVKDVRQRFGTQRAIAVYNPTDQPRTFRFPLSDIELAGRTEVRDLMARKDLPAVEAGQMAVDVLPHDTRIFLLTAAERLERTRYEAETAWLNRYQDLGHNPSMGYATYVDDAACSGGAKVGWLGSRTDNYMEWRDVYSADGGTYSVTLAYSTSETRQAVITVNGRKAQKLSFTADTGCRILSLKLKPGTNIIRVAPVGEGWCPDIDYMEIKRNK